ncbi:MAG: DUF5671 domain-containing protein [Candidatus Magasanikbacteria bacterium]
MTEKGSNSKPNPKEVFLYILSIASLYFSVGAFLNLVFTLINVSVPDPANPVYGVGSSLRWSISLLLVLFPVYLWSIKKIHELIQKNPKSKNYRIRKWLVNLTLFLAGGIILGDLITLINNFLSGELTIRFILKVLAVLIVFSAVFGYYKFEAQKNIETILKYSNKITYGVSFFVLLALIAGFSVSGSPFRQRKIKLDNHRIEDLEKIQERVMIFWRDKKAVPSSLSELKNHFDRLKLPKDPVTKKPYEYEKIGKLSFEICANFSTKSTRRPLEPHPPSINPKIVPEDWTHEKGKDCFQRKIKPKNQNKGK